MLIASSDEGVKRFIYACSSSTYGDHPDLPKVEDKNSDILLIATHGDRCDLISQEYYGSPEYWWFIATVNKLSSNNIEAGTQLRVPVSLEEAILK